MSPDEIHIEPTPENRVAFARWGVSLTPKARTVGISTFAIEPGQFVDAPEEILIGALVDGHRYVSPTEDEANGTPPPGGARLLACGLCYEENGEEVHPHPECTAGAPGAELLGVATEEGFTAAAAAGGDSSGPDFAPLDDAPAENEGQDDEGEIRALYACPLCPRDFETERGRDTHRRQAHRED